MKTIFISSVLIFSFLSSNLSYARFIPTGPIQCPEQVTIKQEIIPGSVPEWVISPIINHAKLNGWTIYEGKVGDTRYAQAPSTINRHGKTIQVWNINEKSNFPHKHHHNASNFWISCAYAHTPLVLQREIPSHIQQCHSALKAGHHHNVKLGSNVICK